MGSGAAGLSAALAASADGARVLVLEKSPLVGGSTSLSGGCVWVPANHVMQQVRVTDSPEEALQYIRAVAPAGWQETEDARWRAWVEQSPRMLEFVERHSPLRFRPTREPDPYAEAPGGKLRGRNVTPAPVRMSVLGEWQHKVRPPISDSRLGYDEIVDHHIFAAPRVRRRRFLPRVWWRRWRGLQVRGTALVAGLLKGCLDHGVEVWTESSLESLSFEGGGFSGCEVTRRGASLALAARHVVLAAGGFEWNASMMGEHFPGPVEWTATPNTNSGDGHRLLREAGGELAHMDQALIMGTTPVNYEGAVHGQPAVDYTMPHSMIVNRRGRRFVNEKQMNIGLAFAERDPTDGLPVNLPAWRIFDGEFARRYPHALPDATFPGNCFQADTLVELARLIEVDAAGLVQAARRFSEFARRNCDEDFGRGTSVWDRERGGDPAHPVSNTLGAIETPPFFAMPFKASFLGTKGGARTNTDAQVLRPDGSVIPGLYAAGNVMANPIGSKGVGAGTTLGPCLTWGYIAGRHAARSVNLSR